MVKRVSDSGKTAAFDAEAPRTTRPLTLLADTPIEDDTGDRLGFKPYADALFELLDSPATKTPFTIAISAPWGAGKTSLAKMVQRRLVDWPRERGDRPHIVCWFNAWAHDDAPHLGSAFAAQVARVANRHRRLWQRFFSPLPSAMLTSQERWRRRLLLVGLVFLLTIAAGLVMVGTGADLSPTRQQEERALLREIGKISPRLAVLVPALAVLFAAWGKLFSIAQAAASFVGDPKSEASKGTMAQVSEQLHGLIRQATRSRRRLVLFVDDLERCEPRRAMEVCEAAIQLLSHPDTVIVVVANFDAIAASAGIHPAGADPIPADRARISYGRRYLEKLVQIHFELPAPSVEDIRSMLAATSDSPSDDRFPSRPTSFRRVRSLMGLLFLRPGPYEQSRRQIYWRRLVLSLILPVTTWVVYPLMPIVYEPEEGSVRLWDPATGQPIGGPLSAASGSVHDPEFSPDSKRLATTGDDGVHLWDPATGQLIGSPLTGFTLEFSPDSKRLATTAGDRVRLWDPTTGEPIGSPLIHPGLGGSAFSPDSKRLATTGDDRVRLWDPTTGEPIGSPLIHPGLGLGSLRFSPDSKRLATTAGYDGVHLWDPATGQLIGSPLTGFTPEFSPDSKRLATTAGDGVRLWDPLTGEPIGSPLIHPGLGASAFSPDGQLLATAVAYVKSFSDFQRLLDIWIFVASVSFVWGLTIILVAVVRRVRARRARRAVDREIKKEAGLGGLDQKTSVRTILKSPASRGASPQLVYQRLQRFLAEESSLRREAEAEIVRFAPLLPRSAKRMFNRLRLLLAIAVGKEMFGGSPELCPAQLGRWVVLQERWPELAAAVQSDTALMGRLASTPADRLPEVLKQEAPGVDPTEELVTFLATQPGLSGVIARLVRFEAADKPIDLYESVSGEDSEGVSAPSR